MPNTKVQYSDPRSSFCFCLELSLNMSHVKTEKVSRVRNSDTERSMFFFSSNKNLNKTGTNRVRYSDPRNTSLADLRRSNADPCFGQNSSNFYLKIALCIVHIVRIMHICAVV